jgi:two-component system OmpR family sensor kinase
MFRRRLSLVLIVLAATVVLQGLAAVLALRETQQQVLRGRIASDILQRFVELSATKQRLRSWVTQRNMGAGGDAAERQALERRMRAILQELGELTTQAAKGPGLAEHEARLDALQVLRHSVEQLSAALVQTRPLSPQTQARQAWEALAELFEQSEGRDLRELIAQSIEREKAAMERERAAADASLARMRALWVGMALALALAALAATVYFARALRRPLDALAAGAQALGEGRLAHRIDLQGRDEFGVVAGSMNTMAEALERHQLREAQQRHVLEVTVRQRTDDLHRANESLRQTDVRRRQLLADISHELRTPTTAIRGEAEVTLRGVDRPAGDYREALQRIVVTSQQLGAVIDDLLALARSDMDTLSLSREPVSLPKLLDQALDQAAALAAERQVALVAPPEEPGPCQVFGDAQRLRQLLLILLDNAIRYSHPGGSVQWRMRTHGDWLELSITDQGIGIPPDELPLVFERHFRGQAARRHRASGSGLGLPIAQSLARAHGASLDLASPLGPEGGTRALLRLPLWRPGQAPDAAGPLP